MSEVDFVVQDREGDRYLDRYTETAIIRTKEPITVAKMAIEMVSRWGGVAAADGGEDSAGRQKLRFQEAGELAQRACDTASALWAEFERRGWLVDLPIPRKLTKNEREKADA